MSYDKNLDLEDDLTLSSSALAALNEFYLEQHDQQKFQEENDIPSEDWQLSQFWYSHETSERLVDECIKALGNFIQTKRIACISSPSLIRYFLRREVVILFDIKLFEFDKRFAQKYPDKFIFYDYCKPLEIPSDMLNLFDLIIVDPPFIALECLVKVSQTIRLLSKNDGSSKIILCTGSAYRLLKVEMTHFKPQHEHNLANDFSCFTNYKPITL